MTDFFHERKGVLTVTLYVQPRAKKTEIVGTREHALKIKVAAPPVDGEANEEIARFFSKFLKIPKSAVQLKQGAASRNKVLEIKGVSASEFTQILLKHGYITISLA